MSATLLVAFALIWVVLLVWEFCVCGDLNEEQMEAHIALAVINARAILREINGTTEGAPAPDVQGEGTR